MTSGQCAALALTAALLACGCGREKPAPAAKAPIAKSQHRPAVKSSAQARPRPSPEPSTAADAGTPFPIGDTGVTSTDPDFLAKLANLPATPAADADPPPAAPPADAASSAAVPELNAISDHYVGAIVIDCQRILASPTIAAAGREEFLSLVKDLSRFDLSKLKRITVLFPDPVAKPNERPVLLVTYDRPHDTRIPFQGELRSIDEIGEALGGGRATLVTQFRVLAPSGQNPRLRSGREPAGPVASLLKAADLDHDVVGAVVLSEPMRTVPRNLAAKLRAGKENGQNQLPDDILEAADSLETGLASATFHLDLAADPLAELAIAGRDEAASRLLHKALSYFVEQMRPTLKEELRSGPLLTDVPAVVAELAVDPLADALAQLKLEVSGNQVVARIPAIPELDEKLALSLARAGEAGRLTERMNNLRQTGIAFHTYHDTWKVLSPASVQGSQFYGKDGKPLLSWRVHILPQMESNQLYDLFHLDEPWDSEHNRKLLEKMPIFYKTTEHPTKTTLMAFVGNGALYDEDQKGQSFFQIRDGLANTIMVVDAGPDKAVPWTKPDNLLFDPRHPQAALGTLREDFLLTLMADGRVLKLRSDIPDDKFRALITRAGGEEVNPFELQR